MKSIIAVSLIAGSLIAPGVGIAQESGNRVAANSDWSVFVENGECWSVSAPKTQVNTRDGRVVSVQRGQTLMFVSYKPDDNIRGEISVTGGYPYASGSPVTVTIGDNSFQLFTEGEWAWTGGPEEDARLIEAMKAGADAVVSGVSSRGTATEDTFSLIGFTASVDDAGARCQ